VRIHAQFRSGKTIDLTIDPPISISELKAKIIKELYPDNLLSDVDIQTICDDSNFRCVFSERDLDNPRTIRDYDISSESTISVVGLEKVLSTRKDHLGLPEEAPASARSDASTSRASSSAPIFSDKETLPLIHHFESLVAANPDSIALVYKGKEISYSELNQRANQLARHLLAKQLNNSIVGISGNDKVEMIVSQLAIMKVNSTFVVFDEQDPEERISFIAQNAEVSAVIHCGTNKPAQTLIDASIPIVDVSTQKELINSYNTDDPGYTPQHTNPAYLLYTSGSTANQPKGVIQLQKNIIDQIEHYTRDMGITHKDRLLQLATLSHDQAIVDIYGALLNGATLVVSDVHSRDILKTIKNQRVSIFSSIPSMFDIIFKHAGEQEFPDLRIVTIGGEETTLAHARLFQSLGSHPESKLINGYGATECSWVSSFIIDRHTDLSQFKSFPLGPLTAGIDCLISTDGYEVGGELLIHGDGVSPGYWKNDEENRNAFVTIEGKNYYKTGDIVASGADGCLHFLGRAKWHEKIRGQRVNMKEIEDSFTRELPTTENVIIAVGDGIDKQLVAFVAGDPQTVSERITKINTITETMPEYMIPSQVVHLSEMPRLANGKINRNALRQEFLSLSQQASSSSSLIPDSPNESSDLTGCIDSTWNRIFSSASITARSNGTFFALGGNSIKAMDLINSIRDYCEKELRVTLDLALADVYSKSVQELKAAVFELINAKSQLEDTTSRPVFKTGVLGDIFYDDTYENAAYYFSPIYFPVVINFEAMCVLADHYNEKYKILISPCSSYEQFAEKIVSAIRESPKPLQIGLTLPQNNMKDAHPTPCILAIDENNNVKLLVSDSIHSRYRVDVIKKDVFAPLNDKYPELRDVTFLEDPYMRQLDDSSCSVDAIAYLKNTLRGNILAYTHATEDGLVTKSIPESFKTSQNPLPEGTDISEAFSTNPDKNLDSHRAKYTRSVTFFPSKKIMGSAPLAKTNVEIERNVYLYEKSKKFVNILTDKLGTKNSTEDKANEAASSVPDTPKVKFQPKHIVVNPRPSLDETPHESPVSRGPR
jgi:amino acid adenylation domain-containing protein